MTAGPSVTFIVATEPRVRRRWWAPARRARRAAEEAVRDEAPSRFLLALQPAHPANPNKGHSLYLVGHDQGLITTFATTTG